MRSGQVLWLCVCLSVAWGEGGQVKSPQGAPEEKLVRSPQGSVRGYKQPGDSIFVFYGIPYATAPTGTNKFRAPLPAPAWFSVLDAVDNKIACPQVVLMEELAYPNTTENCLVANVYVPDTEQKNLPVVVYVHGGAYLVGSGTFMEAKQLVRSKKVIVVTFNYRLGIHGFLCLGTEDAPGNAGMKDQVALLRWVKRNIASYGGNPKDVTIAGYSAGSSAVDLLVLSPATKDLFHRVIPESGANLASWSIQSDPIQNAKDFAISAGFKNVDDIYALEDFFKSASNEVLTSIKSVFGRTDATFVFTPCVERQTGEEAFLTDSPYNILKNGNYRKVPLLYGFADMEGMLRLGEFDTWKDKMNSNFSEFLPIDLQFESFEEKEEVSKKIKEFYFGEEPVGPDNILEYINYMSDVYFCYSTLRAVRLYVESGNDKVYLYEYNFVDDSAPAVPHTDNVKGANHCAQTMAIFDGTNFTSDSDFTEINISEDYKKMKSVTREIWLNFITKGEPVPPGSSLPDWPAAGASGAPHMSLGRALELRGALLERRVRFWDDIYERHYRVPQPPPAPPTRHTEL